MSEQEKNKAQEERAPESRRLPTMTIVGLVLLIIALATLFISPSSLDQGFMAMVERAHPIVINVGLLSTMSVAIVLSVTMGRILERLGFTDALMLIFVPIGKLFKFNPAVMIPAIYNILGDINAAGRISGPILVKSGATLDEKKLAIFTMVQSQQSFSTFMFGMGALTLAGTRVGLVVFLALFLPLLVIPPIGRFLLYRNCKAVEMKDMPNFTPNTPPLTTVFSAGQEGMNVLLTLVLPAFAVVFGFIGLLTHIGIWPILERGIVTVLEFINIDPSTGLLSIMASPTLAMNNLREVADTLPPQWVIGSFVLAASGFPLSVILGQIPLVWSSVGEMKASDALKPALLGVTLRVLTAGFIATVLGGLLF